MAPIVLDASGNAVPIKTPPSVMATAMSSAEKALDAAILRFEARNPRSRELHELATLSMPGGNTRTQLYTSPSSIYMKSGRGYQVMSEDGHMSVSAWLRNTDTLTDGPQIH